MTTTLPESTRKHAEPEPRPSGPPAGRKPESARRLEDRLPEAFKSPRALFVLCLFLSAVFCLFSYRPLWHTDLWGHLAYARHFETIGALPATEPLMPLADGVPFVDTAWLSQWVGLKTHRLFGVPGLQFLYALSISACLGVLLWRSYRKTASAAASLLGGVFFLWVDWQQLTIVRPQLAGLVCFMGLFGLLTSRREYSRRWQTAEWFVVPGLFVVWANLHGSFVIGLGLLGAYCAGCAVDVFRRTRRLGTVLVDRQVGRLFLLAELSAVAALINPYGARLYAEVVSVASHPNLNALIEWQPLTLRMKQGQAAAVAALLLVVFYRLTPRRIAATEVLLLCGLGAGALWTSRLLVWWAPLAAYYATIHLAATCRARFGLMGRWQATAGPRRSTWTVASLGVLWIGFAYTPFGLSLLHGLEAEPARGLSKGTPAAPVEYLRENRPDGQVFNSYEWGDYLLWAGPEDVDVFVASHAHLIPRKVWQDYLHVANVGADWDAVLDRYGVNTVFIDKTRQDGLTAGLRSQDDVWQLDYEDDRAAIFIRRDPI